MWYARNLVYCGQCFYNTPTNSLANNNVMTRCVRCDSKRLYDAPGSVMAVVRFMGRTWLPAEELKDLLESHAAYAAQTNHPD
jgi:hypothetical protein